MPLEVKMPRLSDTMEVGTVVKWNVKPGQTVKSGDVVADIETDKATMELQSFDDGTVATLPVNEGQSVKVGTVIMVLAQKGEDPASIKTSGGGAPAQAPPTQVVQQSGSSSDAAATAPPPSVSTAQATTAPARSAGSPNGATNGHAAPTQQTQPEADRVFASPLARKIAGEHGVDLVGLHGSGPSGRIIRKDVEAALSGGGGGGGGTAASEALPTSRRPGDDAGTAPIQRPQRAAQQPAAPLIPAAGAQLEGRVVQLSNMRRIIASRLVESKTTIPHYQVTVSARMDALLSLRAQLNEQLASQGVKLSVNDFLVRACALAMHQHPMVNSRWTGPKGQESVEILGQVNVGIAIALPEERGGGGGGLVVATIRDADRKGLRQISAESKSLSEKARTKGLTIEEMADSTYTISNLGMFGVEHFNAIINPPNAAILAVGAAIEKPVVVSATDGSKSLGIGHEMSMTQSSDHRVVDGAMAARYLATVKDLLEKPATLLV
ncbi:MAG: 2-oxo acid dehydrogenase subunit E2 [Phycisphaerales bacterium]|nr:2-oxo acid dehydrogenase subunit E2 [Phycisphaerales bacterium]